MDTWQSVDGTPVKRNYLVELINADQALIIKEDGSSYVVPVIHEPNSQPAKE